MTPADRRLVSAVIVETLLGLACVGYGAWSLLDPGPVWEPVQFRGAPLMAAGIGLVLLGMAAWQSASRLRNGPDPAGRHSR